MSESNVQALVERLIRPEIRALKAYAVGDASGMRKLDAMENPYTWPDDMVQQWQALLAECALNRYPHPLAPEVVSGLRDAMQIPPQQAVLLGNGSDEIIQMLALALNQPEASLLAPEPGFVMYKMIAAWVGMGFHGVALNEDFSLDLTSMLEAIEVHEPALIFLALPNNPSGNLWSESDLQQILEKAAEHRGLVVFDEAYLPFSSRDHLSWLGQHSNLLIMRTLSKAGLAGLRLGMLIGSPEWLSEFDKVRMPYNINVLTQASAAFALRHYDTLMAQCARICDQRTRLFECLTQLGFECYPTEANFILARAGAGMPAARELFEGLKQHNILIKCLDGAHPLLQQCLRFTVGEPSDTDAVVEALQQLLAT